ncbi:MAG: hypothetical protein ACYCWW_20330, partial [Deltaproteobacteria bacterium]
MPTDLRGQTGRRSAAWRSGAAETLARRGPETEPARFGNETFRADLDGIGSISGRIGSIQGGIEAIPGEIGSIQDGIRSISGEIGSIQGR